MEESVLMAERTQREKEDLQVGGCGEGWSVAQQLLLPCIR